MGKVDECRLWFFDRKAEAIERGNHKVFGRSLLRQGRLTAVAVLVLFILLVFATGGL